MRFLKWVYFNLAIFSVLVAGIFFLGAFLHLRNNARIVQAQSDDQVPPVISDIRITEITATSTTIVWKTDEESDSIINYGLNKKYGMVRDPHFDKIDHMLILDELLPNSNYFFRITSTDEAGNQIISNDFTFTTPLDREYKLGNLNETLGEVCDKLQGEGAGGQKEEKPENPADEQKFSEGTAAEQSFKEGEILQEILEQIDRVKEEKTLEVIQDHLQNVAEDISSPLTIILDSADLEIGSDYVIIYWKTNKEANSVVSLAREDQYDEIRATPYSWNEGFPDIYSLDHRVEITGLAPATIYHFQVSSKTQLDQEAKSADKIFKTKSIQPEIYNLSVTKIQEDSATLSWLTNIPTSAIAEYTNLNLGEAKLEGHSNYVTTHSLQLKNLAFDTYYSVIITVENEQNEKTSSAPITFITTRDQVSPLIAKVSTESTLYPGSDNKVQTIVSWETDEPSKCQLTYHRGIISLEEPDKLQEEQDFTGKHVQVVTNFLPATVYKFWIECKDDADNKARSEDFTMLTPSQEESIIDIILKNFESTFGWVKKIKVGG
jgi:hypothetical protein